MNEELHIGQVLDGLIEEQGRLPDMEIVVADGGSTDATIAIVQKYARAHSFVHFLPNPGKIQSAAVNLVARIWADKADVLIRCDAHAGYPGNFVANLLETLCRTKADSVVVPMDTIGRRCVGRAVAWVSDTSLGSGGAAHRGGTHSGYVDHGHHAAFRLKSFIRAGGYDETFTHNEDAELDCRLRKTGGTIYLDAGIRIRYLPRESLTSLARQYFNYGKGRARTMSRHPGSARLRQFAVPLHMLMLLASMAAAFYVPHFLAWPLFYLSVTLVASLGIALKKKSPCGLMASPAVVVMHNAWAIGFFFGILFSREKKWNYRLEETQRLFS